MAFANHSSAPSPNSTVGLQTLRDKWSWGALPKDTRDTLFLLVVIAWVILPHASNVPWWCTALALLVLCWRASITLKNSSLPSRWWRLGLLGVAIAGTLWSYGTLLGQQAGITLIVSLITLKTLELRARRDAYVIFFLGFFALLTHFLSSQQLGTGLSMIVGVWGLLSAVVNAQKHSGTREGLRHSIKTAGGLMLLGAPIMALLFVLFPRIQPLWGIPTDHQSGRTGLSSSLEMGTVAQLAQDNSVALRVTFEGEAPPSSSMYWRGPVLSAFDGRKWEINDFRLGGGRDLQITTSGPAYTYTVTQEPINRPWVMTLEATPVAPDVKGYNTFLSGDMQWLSRQVITELRRFKATSYLDYRYEKDLPPYSQEYFLRMPTSYNPRTLDFAQQLLREKGHAPGDARSWNQEILQLLQTGGYRYTLEPGGYGRNAVDEFLFDRKLGFCEHIASSYVVLMRALKVPARIVTGFQGAEYNEVGKHWVVRNSNAHAWAEIWQEGTGWVRVDPTAVVAPARIEDNARLEVELGLFANAANTMLGETMIRELRSMWEAANYRWNQWVLNYSQDNQFNLLKKLGFSSPSWADIGYILAALLGLGCALGISWGYWERSKQDPWLRLLADVHKDLSKNGWLADAIRDRVAEHSEHAHHTETHNAPSLTPRQLIQAIENWPQTSLESKRNIKKWLLQLEQFRYGKSHSAQGGEDTSGKKQIAAYRRQWQDLKSSIPTMSAT